MTNEDKKIVADYMGWKWSEYGGDYYYIPNNGKTIWYDLNDAGLVVQEMQKRGDWMSFITFADNEHFDKEISVEFSAWLFNAENFFGAMVAWIKEEKNEQPRFVQRKGQNGNSH